MGKYVINDVLKMMFCIKTSFHGENFHPDHVVVNLKVVIS